MDVLGRRTLVSRTGYTGEDGFEIYGDADSIVEITKWLLVHEAVRPIGLGARDTLRLEMGYPLYGNDLDDDTNPYSAGLGWVVKPDRPDFLGRDAIHEFRRRGRDRARVGLVTESRSGVPREGQVILKGNRQIGRVTSGSFSPSLNRGIAMGYVADPESVAGTEVRIASGARSTEARIRRLPLYREGTVRVSHHR
jgi:aminomethyltransferase